MSLNILIEDSSIKLLEKMGYIFLFQKESQIDIEQKFSKVILKDILLKQLKKINSFEYKGVTYSFSNKNIVQAINDLDIALNSGLMSSNEQISYLLLFGKTYSENPMSEIKKSFSLKYIDFENMENNIFHCKKEVAILKAIKEQKGTDTDIVLFINGIPFAVLKLNKLSENIEQIISQIRKNQNEKESFKFFKFMQIVVVANSVKSKYATLKSAQKFYFGLETVISQYLNKLISHKEVNHLDQIIFLLFEKNRVLDFLRYFIIFKGRDKKIASPLQYFTIRDIIKRVKKFHTDKKRQGGLIYHAQGSGKSLTIIMLVNILIKEIFNSRVIVITNKKGLYTQIDNSFEKSGIKVKRATSGKNLITLLEDGSSVITVETHKFEMVKQQKIIFNGTDIFIIVDEVYHTKMRQINTVMKKKFPKSCYIGFTTIPIMKKEKNIINLYGKLVNKYTIGQAIKDRVILPILYEARFAQQWIKNEKTFVNRFNFINKNLISKNKLDLKEVWARFKYISFSERRLEMIMFDINNHFTKNFQNISNQKAILIANSEYEAIKYHTLFNKFTNIKSIFINFKENDKDQYYEVSNEHKEFVKEYYKKIIKKYGDVNIYENKMIDKFKNEEEIKLLIVVNMLFTNFDTFCATVLYIDKELKEYDLLQTITNVNRVSNGKDFGYIIDYQGLLGDANNALTTYDCLNGFDKEDIYGVIIDIKIEIAKVKIYYNNLNNLFKSVFSKDNQDSYEIFLTHTKKREKFYKEFLYFAKALKIAFSSDKIYEVFSDKDITKYKEKMKFYNQLKDSLQIRYYEKINLYGFEQQVQKLLNTFIAVNEVKQLVDIFDKKFMIKINEIVNDNAKADAIINACKATIIEKKEANPVYYEKIYKKIQNIIQDYANNRLLDNEKLIHSKNIYHILISKQINSNVNYPSNIKISKGAIAFYDNIADDLNIVINNYSLELVAETKANYGTPKRKKGVLIQTVNKIDAIFKKVSKRPDWIDNLDVTNEIKSNIEKILWNIEDRYGNKFKDIDKIINKIKSIGDNNY